MDQILLIEDQPESQFIVQALLGDRNEVITASTAAQAVEFIQRGKPDLILLDVGLPDGDGFNLYAKIRCYGGMGHVPIIFLTGRTGVSDRVAGLSLGADDYITKPFEPLEFCARIQAKLRRKRESRLFRKGRFEFNHLMFKAFVVDDAGTRTDLGLTPHEFRLLFHFMSHERHILSRQQLITAAWGLEVHILERTVDRHISTLRQKLDARFETIESVHGIGYRFSIVRPAAKIES